MDVLIGTLIYRGGAYVLDKFLANQKEIQNRYSSCELLFATIDTSFLGELQDLISRWGLKGSVLSYEVEKPVYARSRLWNISCGREAIRRFFLRRTRAEALLYLDADMTFDPSVVSILEKEIEGYDAVFSGYPLRDGGIGLAGAGCLMLTRKAAEKIQIRCCEFKNGDTIFEDNLVEMDLYRQKCRIKKGFFLSIDHYASPEKTGHMIPQKVGTVRQITNHPWIRYWLIRTSIMLQMNVPWRLFVIISRMRNCLKSGQ